MTEGLLRLLDRRELRGVIAHELAHIQNRDILVSSVAAAAAATITSLGQLMTFGGLFGGGGSDSNGEEKPQTAAGTLLLALLAPLAATLVQLGISRSREFLADEAGARLTGDPEALARALIKLERTAARVPANGSPATASLFIVNPFGATERLARWFSTHPSTGERVQRLRALAAGRAPHRAPGRASAFQL